MRSFIIILFLSNALFGQVSSKNKKAPKTFSINGKVLITNSYFGGMEPEQGELELLSKPGPYSGKVFYVRKGKINDLKSPIVTSFTVNSKGEFSIKLPIGTFSIIQKEQVKKLNLKEYQLGEYYPVGKECLENWWRTPYYILDVKENETYDLEFNFHRRCFIESDIPCIDYIGPLPP